MKAESNGLIPRKLTANLGRLIAAVWGCLHEKAKHKKPVVV